ncbi:MAG: HAD hydrolase-like protein, partial [Flavonifractor plautii]
MYPYDTVIFDLDGTLLNTLQDLADSTNYALALQGMPARTLEEVRRFVGNGVGRLIHRAVPEGTPEEVEARVLADFRAHYTLN